MTTQSNHHPLRNGAALLALLALTACASSGGLGGGVSTPPPTPAVTAIAPADGAGGVPLNGNGSATFNVPMDPATLDSSTFTLTSGPGALPVPGTVAYAGATAVFSPTHQLAGNAPYTLTVTTGVKSAMGVALAADRTWSFVTGTTLAPGLPVNPPAPAPTVLSGTPLAGAVNVPLNANGSATFSEAMDPASLDSTTFTLASGGVPVPGTVVYANATAVFWPVQQLAPDSAYTFTVTTGVRSAAGVALAAGRAWSFHTGSTLAAGLPVDLGTAGNYVILAKTGVSTVPTSAVTGDLGVSPAAATYITGFSLTADATNVFSTSPQVTGKVFAANYAWPTPSKLTTAIGDMQLAFTDAAGRAPDVTELGAGDIGGKTLAPGVYQWSTGLLIPTDVTLSGGATAVWIFQIAQGMTMNSGARVLLAGGARPGNVFWQVSGAVSLGTTAHCEGVVLGKTLIALHTGATVNGRLLAQTAVTIDGSTIVQPAN